MALKDRGELIEKRIDILTEQLERLNRTKTDDLSPFGQHDIVNAMALLCQEIRCEEDRLDRLHPTVQVQANRTS